VEEYLEEEGIKHEFSAPYTPQQNGVVERKNRTLIDMVRTMLGEFKTPERFWSEAVNTACHAINRVYLHRLLKKTSYELLTATQGRHFHLPNEVHARLDQAVWDEGRQARKDSNGN
jgi:transposase InsO family protein